MRKKNIIIIAIVAAVAIVAVAAGTWLYFDAQSKADAEAIDAAAIATYEKYRAIEQDLVPVFEAEEGLEADSREVLIEKLEGLISLETTVTGDVESFRMSDGTLYRFDELVDDINKSIDSIVDWFIEGYKTSKNDAVIDLATEVMEELEASNAALHALLALMEKETHLDIWESNEVREAFIAEIQAKVDANNVRIEELKAIVAEREAQEAAQASSGGSWGGSGSSGGSGTRPLPNWDAGMTDAEKAEAERRAREIANSLNGQ